MSNKLTILIEGASGAGKTSSFEFLQDQEGVLFLNCEGKELPYPNDFCVFKITDPYQVHAALNKLHAKEQFKHPKSGKMVDIHTVVVDSFTFLMDMYEALYVRTAEDTRGAWGNYGNFIRETMLDKVAKLDVPFLATTHIMVNDDMDTLEKVSRAAIKGSVGKGNGLESYFTTVVYAKQMRLKDIEPFLENASMLTLTEEEKFDERKHVFVTRPARQHSGDRIKSPRGVFEVKDLYTDNNTQALINHIRKFYGTN